MYGIMRMKKFARSACYGVGLERNRTADDGRNYARSQIDKDLTDCNVVLHGKDCHDFNDEISRQIEKAGVKERPDSIVMVGVLFTASAEYFTINPAYVPLQEGAEDTRTREQKQKFLFDEKAQQYFEDCYQFCVNDVCQGDESRIFSAKIDFDETTPHLQMYIVPLHERENKKGISKLHLSAKDVFGNRSDLRARQDRFHEQVGKPRNLERGEKVDWDVSYEERKKHETTHEHNRKQRAAVIVEQEQTIVKNDAYIKEQEQAAQRAADALTTAEKATRQQEQQLAIEKAKTDAEVAKRQKYLSDSVQAMPVRNALGIIKKDKNDTMTVHKNVYEGIKDFRYEHQQDMQEMRQIDFVCRENITETEKLMKNEQQLIEDRAQQLADDYVQTMTADRAMLDALLKSAADKEQKAKEYFDNEVSYILGTAQKMVDKAMQYVDPQQRDNHSRLLDFLERDYPYILEEFERVLELEVDKVRTHVNRQHIDRDDR